jgi:hypothetical protein
MHVATGSKLGSCASEYSVVVSEEGYAGRPR